MKEIIGTLSLFLGFVDFIYLVITLFQVYQNIISISVGIYRFAIELVLLAIFIVVTLMCVMSDDENDLGSVK